MSPQAPQAPQTPQTPQRPQRPQTAQTYAIEAAGLTKAYRTGASSTPAPVLRGIDLRVPPGSVFALLGPNGAGKTTTVRILATLTEPDAGTAAVAGYDIRAERSRVRRAISLTGQFAAVDEGQTGAENLRMMARLAGLGRAAARERADELLDRFGLSGAGGRLVRTYSGGMRRRVDLAAGLVGEPEVIFLDEPTTGLDPRSRRGLWDAVSDLAASGTTVFLTTQYLEEADRLADRIAVLHGGVIAAQGTAAELKSRVPGDRLDITLTTSDAYLRGTARAPHATHHDPATRTLGLPTDGTARHVRALLDELDPTGTEVESFTLRTATLDDVFLALTSEGARTALRPQPTRKPRPSKEPRPTEESETPKEPRPPEEPHPAKETPTHA